MKERAAFEADNWLEGAPELVIEVVSPRNRRLERKADFYWAGGASQVWLVNPVRRTITVFRSDGDSPVEYRADETITFEGIAIKVAAVFGLPGITAYPRTLNAIDLNRSLRSKNALPIREHA